MLRATLKFARPRVTIMLWALAFIGGAVAGDINTKTLLTIFLLASWYIHATTINDYADLAIDKINLKKATDRPLLSGSLSAKQLWILHFSSGGIAIGLSILYGKSAVLLTLIMFIIDYIYSLKPFRLSDRGLLAQLILAFAYVYYPISLGYWSVGKGQYPWVLSAGIFTAFVARMLLKDFRDVEGDKKHGKQTFLLRHGAKTTILLSAAFWIISSLIMGFYISLPGFYLILTIGLLQGLVLLTTLGHSSEHNQQQTCIIFIAKTGNAMIITLLVFLLSRNQGMGTAEIHALTVVVGVTLLLFNWLRYSDYRRTLTIPRSASTSTS